LTAAAAAAVAAACYIHQETAFWAINQQTASFGACGLVRRTHMRCSCIEGAIAALLFRIKTVHVVAPHHLHPHQHTPSSTTHPHHPHQQHTLINNTLIIILIIIILINSSLIPSNYWLILSIDIPHHGASSFHS
jgi:hypothetical protein